MMSHLSTSVALREKYNNMPVKTARVLKHQIEQAGVMNNDGVVRSINGTRLGHMQRLDVKKMEQYGISVTAPENLRPPKEQLL